MLPKYSNLYRCLITSLLPVVAPALALAHHSLAEVFDRDSTITLTGTVTAVQWVNPHTVIIVDVADANGVPERWLAQADPPSALLRRGWDPDAIAVGDVVTLTGFESLDGSRSTYASTVTLPSGETLQASSDGSWNWTSVTGLTPGGTGAIQFIEPR